MLSTKKIWILWIILLICVLINYLPLVHVLTSCSLTEGAGFEPPVEDHPTTGLGSHVTEHQKQNLGVIGSDANLRPGIKSTNADTSLSFYDYNVHESPPFAIFYNIFVPSDQKRAANSLRIVKSQLSQVGKSYAASLQRQPTLFYNTIGKRDGVDASDMQSICHDNNLTCTHMEHYDEGSENVTLQKVHDFCSIHEDHRVVYLHPKGAHNTRPQSEGWRRHMTAAATSQDCLAPPNNTCNLCGWVYYPFWASFMPGNIWTAQCSYIQQLLPPKEFKQKQRNLAKEVLMLEVRGTLSSRMFPRKKDSTDLYGLDRFADEHWVGSHPAVVPCDLAGDVDLALLWSSGQEERKLSHLSMAPQAAVDAKWWGSDPRKTRSILGKEKERIREYYFLGGRLFLWLGLYDQVPPESSWVWNWFPDGARWRNIIAGSNQTMERLMQVLETNSFQD